MGEGSGHNGADGHSLAGWGSWLGAWLTATTIGTWLFTVTYFIAAGDLLAGWAALLPLSVLPLIVLPFLVLVFVVPMTLVAAGLRGLCLHAAPSSWRSATVPAVVAGSLSGPLGQFLLDLVIWTTASTGSEVAGRMPRGWWLDTVSFGPPLILGGATAAYVAHRCWWPNSPRWWVLLATTCVAGGLLLSPTDPTLPFGPERPGPWRSELPLGDEPPRGSPTGAGSAGALPSLPVPTHKSPPGQVHSEGLWRLASNVIGSSVQLAGSNRRDQGVEQEPPVRRMRATWCHRRSKTPGAAGCACRPEPRPREERSCFEPSWS